MKNIRILKMPNYGLDDVYLVAGNTSILKALKFYDRWDEEWRDTPHTRGCQYTLEQAKVAADYLRNGYEVIGEEK